MEPNYKYKSLPDFRKGCPNEYNWLASKGLLKQLCVDMGWPPPKTFEGRKPAGYWNVKENCMQDAKQYDSAIVWFKASPYAYKMAHYHGWLKKCTEHMFEFKKPIKFWVFETCKAEALKFNSKAQWEKFSPISYSVAVKNKWMIELTEHMYKYLKHKRSWNKQRCFEEVMKAESYSHFIKNYQVAYQFMLNNNLQKEVRELRNW
jgi:hypothetical protein